MRLTGGCLCGAVTYASEGPWRPVIACHCSQCRKASGHYVSATSVPREGLEITGEVRWFQSSEEARRGFCPNCGSQLFWDGAGANTSIMAGTLEGPTGLATKGHIFCADKGDYYEIPEGSRQVEGNDPALTTRVD
ncbi:GFA family protein [Oceanicola sp. 502str15]|uniref:GFA family protein n=1 Tax=Oceanicola sp. 502str15 TaxID=2696061 RepID=UPI002095CEAE|nr:GFA family protein [Oceanicola sp. 502str15]MCO6383498.1 GFA family protein [Oceanicola sp. 502str15]